MKLTAGQTLLAIIGITLIGAGAIVGLEFAHLDIAPIVGLITPTLVVLVGLIKLDSAQAVRTDSINAQLDANAKQIETIAKATNGKLDAALGIVAANREHEENGGAAPNA